MHLVLELVLFLTITFNDGVEVKIWDLNNLHASARPRSGNMDASNVQWGTPTSCTAAITLFVCSFPFLRLLLPRIPTTLLRYSKCTGVSQSFV